MEHLFVCVESRNGTTCWQEIEWKVGETINQAIKRFKTLLGKYYHICDWRIEQW